jgi:hypothetical protein
MHGYITYFTTLQFLLVEFNWQSSRQKIHKQQPEKYYAEIIIARTMQVAVFISKNYTQYFSLQLRTAECPCFLLKYFIPTKGIQITQSFYPA